MNGKTQTSPTPLPEAIPAHGTEDHQTTDQKYLHIFTNLSANETELDQPGSFEELVSHPYYKLTLNQHKELWEAYNKQADEYDKVLIKRLDEDLNTLLIFVSISLICFTI